MCLFVCVRVWICVCVFSLKAKECLCLSILIWLSIELIYFLFRTHPATSQSFLFLGIFCYSYFAKVTHGLPGSQTHDYRCKDFGTHYTNPGVIDFVRCNCQSTTWELLSYGTLLTSYFFLDFRNNTMHTFSNSTNKRFIIWNIWL